MLVTGKQLFRMRAAEAFLSQNLQIVHSMHRWTGRLQASPAGTARHRRRISRDILVTCYIQIAETHRYMQCKVSEVLSPASSRISLAVWVWGRVITAIIQVCSRRGPGDLKPAGARLAALTTISNS
jgi:hypothetical protein